MAQKHSRRTFQASMSKISCMQWRSQPKVLVGKVNLIDCISSTAGSDVQVLIILLDLHSRVRATTALLFHLRKQIWLLLSNIFIRLSQESDQTL